MALFLHDMLADVSPGPPLIGNNAVFYTFVATVVFLFLLLLFWIRRRLRRRS